MGAGHVGLVTAACLADIGHDVVADDDDRAKLALLREGRPWFHEPGPADLLASTMQAGRLRFTADKAAAGHSKHSGSRSTTAAGSSPGYG